MSGFGVQTAGQSGESKETADGLSRPTKHHSCIQNDVPYAACGLAEMTVIANDPPRDGRQWECQCARCGSSLEWVTCDRCGGEGTTAPGELYEEDPLWYDQDAYEPCRDCNGESSWPRCLSSYEWCLFHPLPGRIEIEPSTAEWFPIGLADGQD